MNETVTLQGLANTWASDREDGMWPDKLTAWFHSAVLALKYLNWMVADTRRGFAEAVLPLNVNSTNQNITHEESKDGRCRLYVRTQQFRQEDLI
jgi:hypothetical protein